MGQPKKIKASRYKGVCFCEAKDGKPWMMRFNIDGLTCINRYVSEKDAAMSYDLKMLELGREPVNVLKRKKV